MKLSNIDIFRKIPTDLTQATRRGGLLSLSVLLLLVLVVICEIWTYIAGETRSRIILDDNREAKLDIHFKISFYELPCRFANIELWDYLGNAKLDAGSQVRKTIISGENGEYNKGDYVHSDSPQTEVVDHDHSAKDLGHLVELGPQNYGTYLKENEYTFVLYYVNWCRFCQMVLPVWSNLATHLPFVRPNVKIAQVDCMKHETLCAATKVPGYPTFIMFKGVNPLAQDYHGDRSIQSFTDYAKRVAETPPEQHDLKFQWHEGCLLRGHLKVNRVPGNFHISAKSDAHNFDPKSTNTSHIVHHLCFGGEITDDLAMRVPRDIRVNIAPLDGYKFLNNHGHMSHEHYIKVVSTRYRTSSFRGSKEILGYQMSTSNHQYKSDPNVPEARFSYDLAPTAVIIYQKGRRWYEFVTSLCAIVGGTFTSFALMDMVIHSFQKRLAAPLTPSTRLS